MFVRIFYKNYYDKLWVDLKAKRLLDDYIKDQ